MLIIQALCQGNEVLRWDASGKDVNMAKVGLTGRALCAPVLVDEITFIHNRRSFISSNVIVFSGSDLDLSRHLDPKIKSIPHMQCRSSKELQALRKTYRNIYILGSPEFYHAVMPQVDAINLHVIQSKKRYQSLGPFPTIDMARFKPIQQVQRDGYADITLLNVMKHGDVYDDKDKQLALNLIA